MGPSSLRATFTTSRLCEPRQVTGDLGASVSKQQDEEVTGGVLRSLFNPKGLWLKFSERAGRNIVTPQSLASHRCILQVISVHVRQSVQDVKYQNPENENSNENPQTHSGTCYWKYDYSLESGIAHSPKDGAHGRPLASPIKAHFQTAVDSALVTFHFYTDKKTAI